MNHSKHSAPANSNGLAPKVRRISSWIFLTGALLITVNTILWVQDQWNLREWYSTLLLYFTTLVGLVWGIVRLIKRPKYGLLLFIGLSFLVFINLIFSALRLVSLIVLFALFFAYTPKKVFLKTTDFIVYESHRGFMSTPQGYCEINKTWGLFERKIARSPNPISLDKYNQVKRTFDYMILEYSRQGSLSDTFKVVPVDTPFRKNDKKLAPPRLGFQDYVVLDSSYWPLVKKQIGKRIQYEFEGFYPDSDTIPKLTEESLFILDELKNRGFNVAESSRGNWMLGPRIISFQVRKGMYGCQVDKLYYNPDSTGKMKIAERILCATVQ